MDRKLHSFNPLDELGIDYNAQRNPENNQSLSDEEQKLYDRLKQSLSKIKNWEDGKAELNDARNFINELSR